MGSHFGGNIPLKSLFSIRNYCSKWKTTFWQSTSKFNIIWESFGLHSGIQNPPLSENIAFPRGIQKWFDFDIDFFGFLTPTWRPRCPQDCPRWPQDGPRAPPRRSQEHPKKAVPRGIVRSWPPRASSGGSGTHVGSILASKMHERIEKQQKKRK